MLINNVILNLSKNIPAVDGTGALAYGQNSSTYNILRGVILNLEKSEKTTNPVLFILTDEQKESIKINLKIGIYKQLYENGFINEFQLKLISLNGGGDLC